MPEREGREYHGRRTHSRRSREPSPKRSRRDGRLDIERRPLSTHNVDNLQVPDKDIRYQRHARDVAPNDTQVESKPNNARFDVKKSSDGKINEVHDDKKKSSNPTDQPRSRSHFQQDERDSAGQSGRRYVHKHIEHGRWSASKEGMDSKSGDKVASHYMKMREEGKQTQTAGDGNWRYDRFLESEADTLPSRKRPAFREKKVLPEEGTDGNVKNEGGNNNIQEGEKPERRERWDDRKDRAESRFSHQAEPQRRTFSSRDRFGNRSRFQGRDSFSSRNYERNQIQKANVQVEKWKHDLYEETNRSPPPKNEEDHIAKVEALLAL